jgi:hypothetical protein
MPALGTEPRSPACFWKWPRMLLHSRELERRCFKEHSSESAHPLRAVRLLNHYYNLLYTLQMTIADPHLAASRDNCNSVVNHGSTHFIWIFDCSIMHVTYIQIVSHLQQPIVTDLLVWMP